MNIRQKGQQGERDVQKILNDIIDKVRSVRCLSHLEQRDKPFQRNQNQSAVGGSDLSCPFPLEIEVKRQEALSINTWWKQTIESADRTGGIPILIFKQNRKKWRVMMLGAVPLQSFGSPNYKELSNVRVEIDLDTFKDWFYVYYQNWLDSDNK